MSARRAPAPTSSAATPTCRARPISGLDITSLPLYYGLTEAAWKHWARVWELEYDWLQAQFDEVPEKGGRKGAPARTTWKRRASPRPGGSTRFSCPPRRWTRRTGSAAWWCSVTGGNTVTRVPEAAKGLEKLDLLVVADPHPTSYAQMSERKNNTYLLPICTNFETDGSRTASNRRCNGASRS
jgi:formate dehydrogenase major subunit